MLPFEVDPTPVPTVTVTVTPDPSGPAAVLLEPEQWDAVHSGLGILVFSLGVLIAVKL